MDHFFLMVIEHRLGCYWTAGWCAVNLFRSFLLLRRMRGLGEAWPDLDGNQTSIIIGISGFGSLIFDENRAIMEVFCTKWTEKHNGASASRFAGPLGSTLAPQRALGPIPRLKLRISGTGSLFFDLKTVSRYSFYNLRRFSVMKSAKAFLCKPVRTVRPYLKKSSNSVLHTIYYLWPIIFIFPFIAKLI